jgi:uncharacterized protein
LYSSLFSKAEKHIAVLEALAQNAMGMERQELLKAAKLPDGGNTTTILRELEESSFIRKYNTFGKTKNKANIKIYQLILFKSTSLLIINR